MLKLKQYDELAALIGRAVSIGNESYSDVELGLRAILALEEANWTLVPGTRPFPANG